MATDQDLSILSFDGVRLAFPLNEIVAIQSGADLEENHGIPLAIASLVYDNRRWPVFRLNANFGLQIDSLPEDFHCVCLSADNSQTGVALACDTAEAFQLGAGDLMPEPIPTCMQREATPLRWMLLHDEHILPVSTTPFLATYLQSLMEEKGGKAEE